jgi:cytochrome c biogenesis protein CcmG, thiol:disulfide interchange protein DsbE
MPNPNLLGGQPPPKRSKSAVVQRPNWVRKMPLIMFAIIAGLFLYALFYAKPHDIPSALIGKPVPTVAFPALDGLKLGDAQVPGLTAADFAKGKVTVVNFWATWCPPCNAEHAMLVELKQRMGDSAELVGINHKDQPAAALSFLNRKSNPFSRVGTDATGRGAIDWGVYGMPETFVVNGRGQIAYKHIGEITAESIEQKLLPAIKAAGTGQ